MVGSAARKLDNPILNRAKGHILLSIISRSYISQQPHESIHAEPKWDILKIIHFI
jgi:hypothetical protein